MSSTGYDLEPVLRTVARTTAACLGFGTAVINLYRPAWDDFHTVVVEGSEEASRLLLGQSSTAEDWALLLDERYERRGAYVLEQATSTGPRIGWRPTCRRSRPRRTLTPGIPRTRCSSRCAPAAGEILGILSVDEPTDGRRPDDEQLDLLVGVSPHAALALEHVQQAAAAERQRVSVDHLLAAHRQPRRAPHGRRDARRRLRRRPRRARLREGRRRHCSTTIRCSTCGRTGACPRRSSRAWPASRLPRWMRCSIPRWSAAA